jgi:multidrug resistance protein, MATE family
MPFGRSFSHSFNGPQAWVKSFCQLAIANTLSNLMVPLAGLIDTAFLGHLSDIRHLNGVALATLIFNVIYWSFNFFRMGTTGPTAQAVGQAVGQAVDQASDGAIDQSKDQQQKDQQQKQVIEWDANQPYTGAQGDGHNDPQVWLIVIRNSILALIAGLAILLLKAPIATLGFSLLQAGPAARAAAMDFYNGRILDAPAVLINFVLLGWLLGRGKGRQVVGLAAVSSLSNILLDYWFIRRLGWGSYGAGLATALSQYVTLAVGLGLVVAEGLPWQLWPTIKAQLWQGKALKALFGLNVDILIRTFALVMAMSLFTNLSSGMGDVVLGVNTLLMQVVLMAAYFMDGIALAVESFAGNFYGRRANEALRWLLVLGISASVILGSAIALTLIGWPNAFFRLLTSHERLLVRVPEYVGWLLPVLGFGGIAFTLDGYFLGLTAGRTLRNATLIAVFIGFLPLALVASWQKNPHLLWLALSGLMVMRGVTLGRQLSRQQTAAGR